MANKSTTRHGALSTVIARMIAANDAYGVAARREDKISSKMLPRQYPKAFAGVTGPVEIKANGKTHSIASQDVFYRSHEEIDRAMKADRAAAKGPAERRKIAAKRKSLHAELSRDERRIARAIPAPVRSAHRAAEAALTKAGDAYTAAREAILRYRPKSAIEAGALLAFLATSKVSSDVVQDNADAVAIFRNVAAVLRPGER